MKNTQRTINFSVIITLALLLGATPSALGATYPPKPGEELPGVTTKITVELPPLTKNSEVEIPKAPESKIVYTIKPLNPTKADLKNLAERSNPEAVRVTPGLVMGGIAPSKEEPKVSIDAKSKKSVEIQTRTDVPNSISLTGYAHGQLVVVTAIQGGNAVLVGNFKAGSNGTLILPAVTLTGSSTVKFVLQSGNSFKGVLLRPIASKSKVSTESVKIAK